MGFGSSVCTTTVTFDRFHYYPGEKCTIRINCDNSKCSTAVKSFKLKLKRKVYASGERVTTVGDLVKLTYKTSKYLFQYKDTDHGCGPK